jgi:RNA polymerase sigma-70 factor (ECF subfamily)
MKTPASLLERLRQPNQERAWEQLIDLYSPLIFCWGRRVGLRAEDAADLVQDVFVLLVQKLPQFTYDRHKTFRGWLKTVTLHKCYENHRKGKRKPPIQDGGEKVLDGLAGPDEAAALWEADYLKHLAQQALELIQGHFQPTTWKAFWLYVVEGRPPAEVAVELGLSVGAVHAARFRVLALLRQQLQGLLD